MRMQQPTTTLNDKQYQCLTVTESEVLESIWEKGLIHILVPRAQRFS